MITKNFDLKLITTILLLKRNVENTLISLIRVFFFFFLFTLKRIILYNIRMSHNMYTNIIFIVIINRGRMYVRIYVVYVQNIIGQWPAFPLLEIKDFRFFNNTFLTNMKNNIFYNLRLFMYLTLDNNLT